MARTIIPCATKHLAKVTPLAAFLLAMSVAAQAAVTGADAVTEIGPRKVFVLLFLMLGPFKILLPFVEMTRGADDRLRRKLATSAILLSGAAIGLAGLAGSRMLENFNIPIPVLMLTGGIVLFLVALRGLLEQFSPPPVRQHQATPTELRRMASSLAFPTIVTPYGIAAIIIFATLEENDPRMTAIVAGIALLILLLDWLAMLFAHVILKWLGAVLQLIGVILGVTQTALGLQFILHSLSLIGVFTERTM